MSDMQPEFQHGVRQFLLALEETAPDVRLTDNARELLLHIFIRADNRIRESARDDYESEVAQASGRLRGAIQNQLRERIRGVAAMEVNDEELEALMLTACPLPPFCYGVDDRVE